MSEPTPLPDYRSGREFAELMRRLEMQLHAKNRIWLGEDLYAWQVARLLGAIGKDFSEALSEAKVIGTSEMVMKRASWTTWRKSTRCWHG